jgi:enoyl-CoA hydratase
MTEARVRRRCGTMTVARAHHRPLLEVMIVQDEAAAQVQLDVTDGVAVITLHAPERRNALTQEMAEELIELCDRIDAAPAVGAVVVQGSGGHFCAGAHRDVLDGAGDDPADPDAYAAIGSVYLAFQRVGRLTVPTVAAVRGAAVGAGVNLMMATDLRVVSDTVRIIAGFLRIGLHPGGGHFTLLGRTAGREATSAMALFSEEVGGERAVQLGLAWECLPDDAVEERAFELARRPAKDPGLARAAVASFRSELDPPGTSWEVASQAERASQMWSLRRRALAADD